MRAIGNEVEFHRTNGRVYVPYEGAWMVYDKNAAFFRRCDLGLLLAFNDSEAKKARGRFLLAPIEGPLCGCGHAPAWIAIPGRQWIKIGLVGQVDYTRPDGELKYHPFRVPVELWVTKDGIAHRLRLPSGCIVDERGIVDPLGHAARAAPSPRGPPPAAGEDA